MSIFLLVIGFMQAVFLVGKRARFSAPFMKKHGRWIMIVGSAILTVLSSVLMGTTWVESVGAFVASSATTFVHDLFQALGWVKSRSIYNDDIFDELEEDVDDEHILEECEEDKYV